MAYVDQFSSAADDPASLLTRRKRAARRTVAAHLAFVTVLGTFMVTTEGPSSSANAGLAVTLAHAQEVFLAVAVMAQVSLIGWWTSLASMVRRVLRAGQIEPPPEPQGYAGRVALRDSRVNRGVIRVCMTMIVVLSWLPEIGYLVQARYQITSGGYGDLDSDFTVGTIFIYALLAGAAALTGIFAKLIDRAETATSRSFAEVGRLLASEGTGTGQAADLAPLRRARTIALRWAGFCGCLAATVIVLSVWALATGHFSARVALMAPVLLVINVARFSQCVKAAGKLRRAEQRLAHEHPTG